MCVHVFIYSVCVCLLSQVLNVKQECNKRISAMAEEIHRLEEVCLVH